jgi:prolyl oligopeptidase
MPTASNDAPNAPAASSLAYPPSRRVDQVDTIHGVRVSDPYRWLEDGQSVEVRAWSAAQDKVTRDYLSKLP